MHLKTLPKNKTTNTAIVIFISCVCFFSATAQQPFRFDNVLYKAVFWNDAVRLMNENKNYILLDVRTPGEFADTSQHTHLNMGHLKGARNINIDSFAQHVSELKKYSDKNIFLYCSHSQRSRRVSKLLADSGFKNVYNINGGMSVANEAGAKAFPLKSTILINGNPFKNTASTDALDLIRDKNTVIIDVRSKAEFNSTDTVFSKNLGYIKNAISIPSSEFMQAFKALNISKEKTILLYDLDGSLSHDIAIGIAKMGYEHVYNLFEGLSGFITDNYLPAATIKEVIAHPAPFNVVSIKECINILSRSNSFVVIDARPAEEFNNKSPRQYLNNGRIKNAVNVPDINALAPAIAAVKKDANILVYGSYSGNNDVDICKQLIDKGYKNVYFLYQGIGRFTWACFNIENCKEGLHLLTDHEGLY